MRRFAVPLLVVACSPIPAPPTDATAGASTSTTTAGTTGPPTTGDSPVTTGDSISTSSTATTDTSSTGVETTFTGSTGALGTSGGASCPPPDREEVLSAWNVDFELQRLEDPPLAATMACSVLEVVDASPTWGYTLECTLDGLPRKVELEYTRSPFPAQLFDVGEALILEHYIEPFNPWLEIDFWFAVRRADAPDVVALAGMNASALVPEGHTAQALFGADLTVLLDQCGPEETPACDPYNRLGLDVMWQSEQQQVFAGQFGALASVSGEYRVWLGDAWRLHDPDRCNLPPMWFAALFEQLPP